MVLSSSVTKKLGKTGNALCSDETLELDPATQAALATGGTQQPGGGKFQKPRVSYPKPATGAYGEAEMDDGVTLPAHQGGAVKGVPVSGRSWKLDFKRSSAMVVSNKLIRKGWDRKMKEKVARKQIQDKERKLVDDRIEAKREKKRQEEERKKRKAENQLKSSTVQVVGTNTVKKMSRKQLRNIRKMDVNSEINPAPIQKTKGLKGKVLIK